MSGRERSSLKKSLQGISSRAMSTATQQTVLDHGLSESGEPESSSECPGDYQRSTDLEEEKWLSTFARKRSQNVVPRPKSNESNEGELEQQELYNRNIVGNSGNPNRDSPEKKVHDKTSRKKRRSERSMKPLTPANIDFGKQESSSDTSSIILKHSSAGQSSRVREPTEASVGYQSNRVSIPESTKTSRYCHTSLSSSCDLDAGSRGPRYTHTTTDGAGDKSSKYTMSSTYSTAECQAQSFNPNANSTLHLDAQREYRAYTNSFSSTAPNTNGKAQHLKSSLYVPGRHSPSEQYMEQLIYSNNPHTTSQHREEFSNRAIQTMDVSNIPSNYTRPPSFRKTSRTSYRNPSFGFELPRSRAAGVKSTYQRRNPQSINPKSRKSNSTSLRDSLRCIQEPLDLTGDVAYGAGGHTQYGTVLAGSLKKSSTSSKCSLPEVLL